MPYSDWQLAQLPQIDPAIVRAAVNGDVAAVRQWLDDGNDPNFRYDVIGNGDVVLAGIGKTLLHEVASDSITYRITVDDTEAVERGRCDIARLLLARGAVPDPLRVVAARHPRPSKYHCGRNAVAEMPGTNKKKQENEPTLPVVNNKKLRQPIRQRLGHARDEPRALQLVLDALHRAGPMHLLDQVAPCER